jgi:hypothetical protein
MSLREALAAEGKRVVKDLRDNLSKRDVNATGNLSRSLLFHADNDGLQVSAASYVFTVEEGRGPKKSGESLDDLKKQIEKWLNAKGIPVWKGYTRKWQAFVIAKKIDKEGTALFRRGGNSGVLSSVLNEELIDRITRRVSDEYQAEVLSAIANAIQSK